MVVALPDIEIPEFPALPPPLVDVEYGGPDGAFVASVDLVHGFGRPDAVPVLALGYRSTADEGPFGRGWSLDLPAVVRGTGRRMSRYRDIEGFTLTGVGELVAELNRDEGWSPVTATVDGVRVDRFRLRDSDLRIRVERHCDPAGTHWQVHSPDGTVRRFGATAAGRVADRADPDRVASWLLEADSDPRGHETAYTYDHDEGVSYLSAVSWGNQWPGSTGDWLFTLAFDYGERPDRHLDHRLGFATRMRRRGDRARLSVRGTAVRTFAFGYDSTAARTRLTSVTVSAHGDAGTVTLAPVRFGYTPETAPGPMRDLGAVRAGGDWLDLDGTGLPGLVTSDVGGGLSFRANTGAGGLAPTRPVPARPAISAGGGVRLSQSFADGHTTMLDSLHGPGFQNRSPRTGWRDFATFRSGPVAPGPVREADLDGDGRPDILAAGITGARWYGFQGAEGWSGPEESPAASVLHDRTGEALLADMTGDGQPDLVRIGPGAVTYWPNLGHGRFGDPVAMTGAPRLAGPDFDPARVRLADLDGTGTADLVYFGRDGMRSWPNQCGAGFGPAQAWPSVPPLPDATAALVDVTGNGTGCVVWRTRDGDLRYVELNGGRIPGLLARVDDGRGRLTEINYTHSVSLYARDRAAGRPWRTTAPVGRTVVTEVRRTDLVTGAVGRTELGYRDACYDDGAREWRTFGYLERRDVTAGPPDPLRAESPPTRLTRTWLHSGLQPGAGPDPVAEFWAGDPARPAAPRDEISDDIGVPGAELARALAGRPRRVETYDLDDDPRSVHPVTVTEYAYRVRAEQPGQPAAVVAAQSQELTRVYEREPDDPRVTHELILDIDSYGNPVRTATVAYARRHPAEPEQGRTSVVLVERDFANLTDDGFRVGVPTGEQRYEAGPLAAADAAPLRPDDLAAAVVAPVAEDRPVTGPLRRRLVAATAVRFWDEALTAETPVPTGPRALVHHDLTAVLSDALIAAAFPVGADIVPTLATTGHEHADGVWWARSATTTYAAGAFHRPVAERLERGGSVRIAYDADAIGVVSRVDAAGHRTTADYDPLLFAPVRVTEPNGVSTVVTYDAFGGVATRTDDDGPSVEVTGDPAAVPARRAVRRRGSDAVNEVVFDAAGRRFESRTSADADRWVCERTVHDLVGTTVRSYPPYFTDAPDPLPEADVAALAPAARHRVDGSGRVVRVELGDGSRTRVVHGPWRTERWDANDAVVGSRWLARREDPHATVAQRAAGDAARAHAATPTVEHLDPAGRVFLTVADGGADGDSTVRLDLDADGQPWRWTDPRGNIAEEHLRDLAGRPVRTRSAATGTTAQLHHADGQVELAFGARGQEHRNVYDVAGRPTARQVRVAGAAWRTAEVTEWDGPGEFAAGRIAARWDGAGRVTYSYDGQGRPTTVERRLCADPTTAVDWPLAPVSDDGLDTETFTVTTAYDTDGRITANTAPDGVATLLSYDRRGLPATVTIDGVTALESAEHDAVGRATAVVLGNGLRETSGFDPATGRLTARRVATATGRVLRDLRIEYDAVGNTLSVDDAAGRTLFYGGAAVPSVCTYGYDALDRLVTATGREAIRASGVPGARVPEAVALPAPTDLQAVRAYTERWRYDPAGNVVRVEHVAAGATWTLDHDIDPLADRIVASHDGGGASAGGYGYDEAGNPRTLPGLTGLTWDLDDRLTSVALAGGGTAYYAYDAFGERVRAVVVHAGGLRDHRVEIGAWSRAQRLAPDGSVTEETVSAEIAERLVRERRTARGRYGATFRWRYRHPDHLGSAGLETDADGGVGACVEYHPYGTIAYQATPAATPAAGYRFRGADRDAETGLHRQGVRFYAPWLCRWISADPAGMADGTNRYWFVRANPTTLVDPEGTQSRPQPTVAVSPYFFDIFRAPRASWWSYTAPTRHLACEPECRPIPQSGGYTFVGLRPPPPPPLLLPPPPAATPAGHRVHHAHPPARPHPRPAAPPPTERATSAPPPDVAPPPAPARAPLELLDPNDPANQNLPYLFWTPPPLDRPTATATPDGFGWWARGGRTLLTGGVMLTLGIAALMLLGPVGWFTLLTLSSAVVSGAAVTTIGLIQIGMSPLATPEQEAALNRGADWIAILGNPVGAGTFITGRAVGLDNEDALTAARVTTAIEGGYQLIRAAPAIVRLGATGFRSLGRLLRPGVAELRPPTLDLSPPTLSLEPPGLNLEPPNPPLAIPTLEPAVLEPPTAGPTAPGPAVNPFADERPGQILGVIPANQPRTGPFPGRCLNNAFCIALRRAGSPDVVITDAQRRGGAVNALWRAYRRAFGPAASYRRGDLAAATEFARERGVATELFVHLRRYRLRNGARVGIDHAALAVLGEDGQLTFVHGERWGRAEYLDSIGYTAEQIETMAAGRPASWLRDDVVVERGLDLAEYGYEVIGYHVNLLNLLQW